MLDWMAILSNQTEWSIILMMNFMDLVQRGNLMEQPMDDHVKNVINHHGDPNLPDQLTSAWKRFNVIADFESKKGRHDN